MMIDAETPSEVGPANADGGVTQSGSESPEQAARRWMEEHADALWRFALTRTRQPEVAEEVVQDTLLAAMERFASFAGRSSERTWLFGIAANKISDYYRRTRRAPKSSGHADEDDAVCDCADCKSVLTKSGMWARVSEAWPEVPASGAERVEQAEALRRCIDALPPGQGEAVWLRDILGVPVSEVCKAMGLSDTNLWTRMHRARMALRTCLENKFSANKEKRA